MNIWGSTTQVVRPGLGELIERLLLSSLRSLDLTRPSSPFPRCCRYLFAGIAWHVPLGMYLLARSEVVTDDKHRVGPGMRSGDPLRVG